MVKALKQGINFFVTEETGKCMPKSQEVRNKNRSFPCVELSLRLDCPFFSLTFDVNAIDVQLKPSVHIV